MLLALTGCGDAGGAAADPQGIPGDTPLVDVGSPKPDAASPADVDVSSGDDRGPGSDAVSPGDGWFDSDGGLAPDTALESDTALEPDAVGSADADGSPDVAPSPSTACPEPPADLPAPTISGAGRFRTLEQLSYPGLLPRGLRVFLPADYDDAPDAHYPVLYMHDGQNLFQPFDAAFGVEWQVDEVLDQLVASGLVEPHIVVGVDNTAERIADYTPNVDPQVGEGGKADLYAAFLVEVVKPLVEQSFRVRCGPGDAALGGSSLGGLVSLHVALTHPGAFGRVAAVSPSLWWSDGWMIDAVASHAGPLPERLWIDGGTEEGDSGLSGKPTALITHMRAVRDLLLADGLVFGDSLGALEHQGAVHDEAAWAARLPSVLAFLLADARPVDVPATALSMFAYADALTPQPEPGGQLGGETTVAVEAIHGDVTHLTWPNPDVELQSLAPEVASIDDDGTVTALAAGDATLTAAAFGLETSTTLQVADDSGAATVNFEVDVPASTPAGDLVHVSGDATQLGTWSGTGLVLAPEGTSHFSGAVALPPGATIEFKFTRGSWATVEKSAQGGEIPNRTAVVSPGLVIEATVAAWADTPP